MARYTESGLRGLVRQLLMEASGVEVSAEIKNSAIGSHTLLSIYATDAEGNAVGNDLLTGGEKGVDIPPGKILTVNFTPEDDSEAFTFNFIPFMGTGVTKNYDRTNFNRKFDITAPKTIEIEEGYDNAADEGDNVEMTTEEIAVLARGAGEIYEIVEDPTDPEFAYAVYYTVAPTRAVIIRAPEEDYKGDNIVSSKGQEISPRRYGGSFRKVAQALMDKMKEAHPAVDAAPAADTE